MKPKVKFLTVVWGESYVERFATLALPSFLAPGNLPALAATCDLEVLVMTARQDVEYFQRHAAVKTLHALTSVRYIDIDDLIVGGLYGVTLTLAYARAIHSFGPGMVGMHFVFMNADFVLANGSLANVAKHIHAGRSIVLAPSFRATAEIVEPKLFVAVDAATHTLSLEPRQIVSLALEHPHPTTIARTVTQDLCHSAHPNQVLWWVDEKTVLARYYLIFMLCLKPERALGKINSYCDYGFIPEMCPSGDEVVMADSDEFFMLEVQRRDQEMLYIRPGPLSERYLARSLSEWTTAEHRRAARYDIVFHAGEIDPSLGDAKRTAAEYMERINKRLPTPIPHADHPYWVSGARAFRRIAAARGLTGIPPEADPTSLTGTVGTFLRLLREHASARSWSAVKSLLRYGVELCYQLIAGRPPAVRITHPEWLDQMHLERSLADAFAEAQGSLLVVAEDIEASRQMLRNYKGVHFVKLSDLVSTRAKNADEQLTKCALAFVFLDENDVEHTSLAIAHLCAVMPHTSYCELFIHQRGNRKLTAELVFALLPYLEKAGSWRSSHFVQSSVGGRLKIALSALFRSLGWQYRAVGLLSLIWVLPLLLFCVPLVVLMNINSAQKKPGKDLSGHWSSLRLRIPIEPLLSAREYEAMVSHG